MCGRFFLRATGQDLAGAFDVPETYFPLFERYNIAPGQTVPVVLLEETGRALRPMKWGLIPSWAKDPSVGFKSINARAETVAVKPTFRSAFKRRHCLVPASGFYEWRAEGKKKLPTLFRPRQGLFAFAGLWETWEGAGSPLDTFTILTTSANETVAPTHDRMPVIIDRMDYRTWLDAAQSLDGGLLRPCPVDAVTATLVEPFVNDARHEGPECITLRVVPSSLFGDLGEHFGEDVTL